VFGSHLPHEIDERARALRVTACLDALCNEDVGAAVRGRCGSSGVPGLHDYYRAVLVCASDESGVDAPGERDEAGTFGKRDFEPLALVERQHEVHAETAL
jgi:hypothetical protein